DGNREIAQMQAKIKHQQILSTAVIVEYDDDEVKELGLKEAIGLFAGEKYEDLSE
ncbi:hypothetical protein LCGC14_2271790, partial [marine sediment metagenome]